MLSLPGHSELCGAAPGICFLVQLLEAQEKPVCKYTLKKGKQAHGVGPEHRAGSFMGFTLKIH